MQVYFQPRAFESLKFFFHAFLYHFLTVPIFYFRIFLLSLHPVFLSPRAFSTYLLVEFSFICFWKVLFCLNFLTLSQYLLSLPLFGRIFPFIYSSWIVRFTCCFVFVCTSQHIHVFFPNLVFSLVVISLPVFLVLFPVQTLYFVRVPKRPTNFITD